MKKKVVLIKGGISSERDVSLSTGQGFEQALIELGYPYEVIDAQADFVAKISRVKADVALIALHGKYAEDGTVQGICEYLKLPYTGTGVLGSALCMDKVMSKYILQQHGVQTAQGIVVYTHVQKDLAKVSCPFPPPVVVKPSREGSSVGVSIVKSESEFVGALRNAAIHDHVILIEKYIPGKEITVAVLQGRALTPIEIQPKVDFYNYENKYTAGHTEYHLPPRLDQKTIEATQRLAVAAAEALRTRLYARVDFRVDPAGVPYVIEVNTLPGFTPTSLVPKAARHDGIGFNQLIEILIENASLDYAGVR
jgi:D-alanine-D-alanine ligase